MIDSAKRPTSYADVVAVRGLHCPKCHCRHLPAIKSAPQPDGTQRRVRECRNCGNKVWTHEVIEGCVVSRVAKT